MITAYKKTATSFQSKFSRIVLLILAGITSGIAAFYISIASSVQLISFLINFDMKFSNLNQLLLTTVYGLIACFFFLISVTALHKMRRITYELIK